MSDTRLIARSPISLLTEEHDLLASLLTAYEDLAPAQIREKRQLTRKIGESINRHIGAEEAIFYPALLELRDPVLRERISEAMAEHRLLEALGVDLDRADPGVAADLIVNVMRSLVDRHQGFEQREVFPAASRFERPTLNQMGLEIEERRMREDRY